MLRRPYLCRRLRCDLYLVLHIVTAGREEHTGSIWIISYNCTGIDNHLKLTAPHGPPHALLTSPRAEAALEGSPQAEDSGLKWKDYS